MFVSPALHFTTLTKRTSLIRRIYILFAGLLSVVNAHAESPVDIAPIIHLRNLVQSGNMVAGETPFSGFPFAVENNSVNKLTLYIQQGQLPPKYVIATEQLVNYFPIDKQALLDDKRTQTSELFSLNATHAPSPYNHDTHLLRIVIIASPTTTSSINWTEKVQVSLDFNPELVLEYRLIGYETQQARQHEHQHDDKLTDTHKNTITALYELRYNPHYDVERQQLKQSVVKQVRLKKTHGHQRFSDFTPYQMAVVRLHYQPDNIDGWPQAATSTTFAVSNVDGESRFEHASDDFRFAAAVAGFGQLLNHNAYLHDVDYAKLIEIAASALGNDELGQRQEFLHLMRATQLLTEP
ncbi:YfbK domain-containing protein [Shewanella gaetbuli]|uniref:von Willebrand factor type A domain-containing protein n=1 Tax=Shewanella gaetbuli TaxID=220752 RepID=A0A9X2CKM2_9GAMM|nr:von Willebrand factor type A domain-containing protein [Shewanella gaetbuli]MCL1141800.1 von Willebrand factor type A domain-containing protein [Shewanella gaetbuli]